MRRENRGKRHRIYEIKVMSDIERYAANRKVWQVKDVSISDVFY